MKFVTGNAAFLERARRDIEGAWQDAAERWHDRAHDEFASAHLAGLLTTMREATRTINEIETLLDQAVRQCR